MTYSLPIITSVYWIIDGSPSIWIMAVSNLLFNFKFLLFFRAFQSFEKYFIIITGVIKIVYPFGIFLFFIVPVLGFAHAFFILLRPSLNYSLDQPTINDDPNNPWNLNNPYYQIENGTTAQDASFVQGPDSNTNMFTEYKTALLAVYLFLTGMVRFFHFLNLI